MRNVTKKPKRKSSRIRGISTIPSEISSDSECSLRTMDSSDSMSSEDSDVILIKSPALPMWLKSKWSTQCDTVRSFFFRTMPDEGDASVTVPAHGAYDSSLEAGNSAAVVKLPNKLQRNTHDIWMPFIDVSYRVTSDFFNEISVRIIWSARKVLELATTAVTPIWSTIDLELKKYVDSLSEPTSIDCVSPTPLSITQPSQQHSIAHCENALSSISIANSSVIASVISTPSNAEDSDLSTTIHSTAEASV